MTVSAIANALVFPAGAGMIRMLMGCLAGLLGVPRRRGDDPANTTHAFYTGMCSPQARG